MTTHLGPSLRFAIKIRTSLLIWLKRELIVAIKLRLRTLHSLVVLGAGAKDSEDPLYYE